MMRKDFDVIVCGGGLTGVGAAIAAGRAGRSVLLIERYGCLGGMATVGHVNPFMTHYFFDRAYPGQEAVLGVYDEQLKRLAKESAVLEEWRTPEGELQDPPHKPRLWAGNTGFDSEVLKWVLDEMVEEAGVTLRLHSFVSGMEMSNGHIVSVETTSKSGREHFSGKVFIDTTGDADLAAMTGAPTVFGREEDGKAQAMTVMFRLGDVDLENADLGKAHGVYQKALKEKGLERPGKSCLLMFPYPGKGVVTFNQNELAGYCALDAEDLTRAEVEGRKAIREMVGFLRANAPGFEHCRVEMIAQQVGIRESRRIVGDFVLQVEHLLGMERFPDTVACGGYPIDIHDPDGELAGNGKKEKPPRLEPGAYYDIPYRAFLPRGVENLLVTGRCLSATHVAASAVRVMPICTAMGQAAGEAAAMCVESHCGAGDVDVKHLRNRLKTNGAFLGEK